MARQSIVGLVVGLLLVSGAPATPPTAPDTATKARVEAAFGQLPLLFIENRGQLDPTRRLLCPRPEHEPLLHPRGPHLRPER